MKNLTLAVLMFLLSFVLSPIFGQNVPDKERMVVLPFSTLGVDDVTAQSAESLLRHELLKNARFQLVSEEETYRATGETACTEIPCAIEIGRRLNAGLVLLTKLSALGEKVIAQYMLVDVAREELSLVDKATSATVEDLETVMKRIADSVTKNENIAKSARVDNIMENEAKEPLRRSLRRFTSYSFGYLFPQEGYDNDERSFTMDLRLGAEMNNAEFGLLLGARKGFAVNVFISYLVGTGDIAPYIGGAFGFHWVNHREQFRYFPDDDELEQNKRSDGPEITANAGLRIFRTYDFQIFANVAYLVTFNDYDDRATLFTIGILR